MSPFAVRQHAAAFLVVMLLGIPSAPALAQAGFADIFGAIIQNAMIHETWNRLGPEMTTCLNDAFRKENTSVGALAGRGVTADQQQIRPYIERCNGIIAAAREWRAANAKSKSCVARLLKANNQTINDLAEMGIGPSNSDVRALFSECDQIETTRSAWAQVEGKHRNCMSGLLAKGGQTIDQLIERRIGPADPQMSATFSDCQQIDAARAAWAVLDPNVKVCAGRLLKRGGQNIDMMIEGKVSPGDAKMNSIMGQCQLIASSNLLKNVACVIEGLSSRCDEAYVMESAQSSALDQDQLVTALIAGQPIGKAVIELPAARKERLASISLRRKEALADEGLKRLAPLADPANKFSHIKALDLRKRLEDARKNPKATEADLIKLEGETRALATANVAEIERLRVRDAEMLARGEVATTGRGSGPTRKAALANAYLEILDRRLRELIGSQADGSVGQQFRKQAAANIDNFKAQFVTGAPEESCRKEGGAQACSVAVVFKAGALKSEVQKLMSAALSQPDKSFRFILSYEEKDDEPRRFLIDAIRAEFVNSGYRIIARGGEDDARARGEFDYYLNILDISYNDANPDVGSIGGSGADLFENYILSARVKLLDNNKDVAARQELANVPLLNTKRAPRDAQMPKEARRAQLLPMQAAELARQIYRDINARLLTISAPAGAAALEAPPRIRLPGQYSIRIAGVGQKDRERIRAVRNAVGKALAGVETRVDSAGTNDESIEITFEHAAKFDPEDLVDVIYGVFKDRKATFSFRYEGGNAFVGSIKRAR